MVQTTVPHLIKKERYFGQFVFDKKGSPETNIKKEQSSFMLLTQAECLASAPSRFIKVLIDFVLGAYALVLTNLFVLESMRTQSS